MTVTPVYVIDTSYLCELFAVPHYSTKKDIVEVKRRFKEAIKAGRRLYVSLPAIFELAGHIADVPDGGLRRKLSEELRDTVVSSICENFPWNLVPALEMNTVEELINGFVDHSREKGMSLVDTTLIDEAARLSQTTYRGQAWRVHIWTKDKRLKAREPDNEPDAFLG